MKIVLDTNVLVSGLLSPFGPPAQIVTMVASGNLVLCIDARILTEYREMLMRPKFRFPAESVEALLEQIAGGGAVAAVTPLRERLPDPDDEPFLEVALATSAEALVTGNLRHYPKRRRQGVAVLTPAEFIDGYRSR